MHSTEPLEDELAIAALQGILERMPRRPHVWVRASENSNHIGAMLAESALQAGLNYETVVVPRVQRFVHEHATASTVSGLVGLLEAQDTSALLGINNARKCRTFRELALLLRDEGIETASDLRRWLDYDDSREKLLRVHGIGVKTAAYLRLLAGLPSIAIDVHLRRAATEVGVAGSDGDLERLFTAAAQRSGIPLAEVDGSLWQRGSDRSRARRRRPAC